MATGNRKKYDFKSVGELTSDIEEDKKRKRELFDFPIGIKTPIEFGSSKDGIFKMYRHLKEQIADNFRNLILTNHGERVGHYDFGANLAELAFELGSDKVDTIAMRRIAKSVKKFMPFVQLDSFEPFTEHKDNEHIAKIGVRITYTVPRLAFPPKAIEIILYAAG